MFKRYLTALFDAVFPPSVDGATSGLLTMMERLKRAEEGANVRAASRRESRRDLQAQALQHEQRANLYDLDAKRARRLRGQIDAFLLPEI